MSHKFEATVDGIKFLYDGGEVEVDYNASNGDVVRLTIEPLEVKVTDGFRAAVKKACKCDSSSGGGSGGGSPLIVRRTVSNGEYVLSEDWDTINEAFTEDGRPVLIELLNTGTKSSSTCTYCLVTEVRSIENASEAKSDSGTGYVVVCTNLSNVDFNFKYIFYSDTSSGTLSCIEDLPIGGGSGGSGGGVLVVHANEVTRALDKTWQEIHDADFAVLKLSDFSDGDFVRFAITSQVEEAEGVYAANFVYVGKVPTPYVYITDSPDGYPVMQESGGGGDDEYATN